MKFIETVISAVPIPLFYKDRDGRYIAVNDAFADIMGFTPEYYKGKTVMELWPGEFAEMYHKKDLELMENPEKQVYEFSVRDKDGVIRPVIYGKNVFYDEDGQIAGIVGAFQDITERKRMEEVLRESEEKYRMLADFTYDWEYWLGPDGRYIYVSPSCERITGYRAEEYLADPALLERIVHPDDRALVADHLKQVMLHSSDQAIDLRAIDFRIITRSGEERWIGHYCQPVYDPTGQYLGQRGSNRDITERKQAEAALVHHTEELTHLHRQLETANREANLYLDILTHDIGNTENVSNLYADLLIDSLQGKEEAGYVKKLQRSVQKSIEILRTVATIRRIHQASPELKPMDLDAVIRGVLADFPGSAFHYAGAHYQVMTDDLLSVVFNNLIGNAVKFGGPGVEIAVRVEEEGGFVRVSVEDTGPGVPDDEKYAIFHRYEQQKRGVGEGLGLYLVQILVGRYGGRVWVEDRAVGHPEQGAAFRFTLRTAAYRPS